MSRYCIYVIVENIIYSRDLCVEIWYQSAVIRKFEFDKTKLERKIKRLTQFPYLHLEKYPNLRRHISPISKRFKFLSLENDTELWREYI